MSAARQEMTDLLREVQKLQKELQPVRSAVNALQKREAGTPNAAATGASLKKVATRLESVKQKYKPYLVRLHELLSDEVPAYLQQTPLLAANVESLEHCPGGTRGAPNERDTAASSFSVAKNTSDNAAHLLQQACPPSTPHLLQPENLRFTQQQLRLRAEMVEYLIVTNRIDIAEHLVREYGLPLHWFPRLVLRHRERIFAASANGTESSPIKQPASATEDTAVPTVATQVLRSPMQLPSPFHPRSSATGAQTPSLPRSPLPQPTLASLVDVSPSGGPRGNRNSTPPASSGQSPPTQQQQQRREMGATGVLHSQASSTADTAGAAAAAGATMPDLVARVVSAAMYLKDEYLDRMVLERTLEQHLGTAAPSELANAASTSASKTSSSAATPLERYKACVLSRIANIPRHHLHTQSGDEAFDSAMMNIIEDLLVYGLQKWAEGHSVAATDAEETAAESKKRAELQRTLTTDTLLTPQEMLLADKVWSEDILFLKRPTRFYCVESGLSTDDSSASALAMPRARTTGEMVSKCVAINQDALDSTVSIFIT
ncbi:hypothetical protein JKF63_01746 [Porcisia hertigi]|uniref:Uncharacterized protein n=1 Tax=Porcisia hertigi TaxID=2761500 RepID=A0A836HLQ7_9TRYP|nr:hypothetical protein JKF63_01746 [Porcisia hertigi]